MTISTVLNWPLHGDVAPTNPGQGETGNTGLTYGTNGIGQILTTDVPYYGQVAINGHSYVVDLKQYSRQTIPAQRQPADTSMEPGEQTLNTEGLWRRSQENWVLGAGQYYLDNIASLYSLYERAGENQSLRYRFWTSKNINPWVSGQMTLLPAAEAKYSGTSELIVTTCGEFLYFAEGHMVKFTNAPTGPSPSWTTYDFQGTGQQNITALTTDGANVWAACGSKGVWKIPAGATTGAAQVGTVTPDFIVYGNGRMVCATGPTLVELNGDGSTTAIGAHLNSAWHWTSGCSAPNAIYLGGSVGHVGEIYAVNVESNSTTLAPPNLAAPLPPGEVPTGLVSTAGFLAMSTSLGIRIADISSSTSNGLTYGPVITIPGGSNCITAWGSFIYFGWSQFVCSQPTNPVASVQSSGIGRADLSRFTSPLVPAYCTDLQMDDGDSGSTNWTTGSVTMVNGLPYWAGINSNSTVSGVFGGSGTKVAKSGMFQSGWTRYNTVERKQVASIDYHHDPLNGNQIGAFLILEQDIVVILPVSEVTGSLGPPTPFFTNFQAGEAFNTQVYLQPDVTQEVSPTLRRYTVRSLITPRRMDEVIVPIVNTTRVQGIQAEGQTRWQNTLAEFQFLKGLESGNAIVTYQEGSQVYNAYIDRVELKPFKWDDERSFLESTMLVRLLTIPAD